MSVYTKYTNNEDIISSCCNKVCANRNESGSKNKCIIHRQCKKVLLEKDKTYLTKIIDAYIKKHKRDVPLEDFDKKQFSCIARLGSDDYYLIPNDKSVMYEMEYEFITDVEINNVIDYILNIL